MDREKVANEEYKFNFELNEEILVLQTDICFKKITLA